MKNKLLSIFAAVTILFLSACKDDEKKLPANVIQDADGVTIELTWLTDGTTTQALADADLDLFMSESATPDGSVASSTSGSTFEDFDLNDLFYDDDTYTIKVKLFGNDAGKAITYKVTVSGASVDKDVVTEGSFSAVTVDGTITPEVTIKKVGNKYTVVAL